jgi:hypothetical protein
MSRRPLHLRIIAQVVVVTVRARCDDFENLVQTRSL